jgi:hypothetical protein
MPVSLKHLKVSAKANGLDSSLLQPTDWNDEHVLTMASARMLGRTTAGTGAVEELDAAAVRAFADVAQSGVQEIDTEETDHTLLLGDRGEVIIMDNGATALTLTVPNNSSVAFPTGTEISVIRGGSGNVTIAASGGVTLNSRSSWRRISAQHGRVLLCKTGTNTWNLSGDLMS